MGALTGADVSDGTHHIFMEYKPTGFNVGLIVTLSSVAPVSYTHLDVYKRQV